MKKIYLLITFMLYSTPLALACESSEQGPERVKQDVILIDAGVPFGMTSRAGWQGTMQCFDELSRKGLVATIDEAGVIIHEIWRWTKPAIPMHIDMGPVEAERHLAASLSSVSSAISARAAALDKTIITFGGDHSIAIASISGIVAARGHVGVVWVDAHADINTPETSPSKNIHGMPVAFLLNMIDCSKRAGWQWLDALHKAAPGNEDGSEVDQGILSPEAASRTALAARGSALILPQHIVYIGLRDLEEAEYEILRNLNIKAFFMPDVILKGIDAVLAETMAHFDACLPADAMLHLSLDVDGLDPRYFPSTGTPVPGGLTMKDGKKICTCLVETGRLGSVDFVEINPTLHSPEAVATTLDHVIELVQHIL